MTTWEKPALVKERMILSQQSIATCEMVNNWKIVFSCYLNGAIGHLGKVHPGSANPYIYEMAITDAQYEEYRNEDLQFYLKLLNDSSGHKVDNATNGKHDLEVTFVNNPTTLNSL